ncbi:hypothetical protein KJA13_02780 [Patescibacteria group bacterium]|nr:hypothetical protein [Patescibacteria group bacterium]
MRSNLVIAIVLFLNLTSIGAQKAHGSLLKDDYLWLEYGNEVKNEDGSVTQLLYICYGQFPDQKKDISQLDALEAIYTFDKKDKKNEIIFYKLKIGTEENKPYICINSTDTNRYTVLVKGKKFKREIKYHFLAKASFFLFGNSKSLGGESRYSPTETDNRFDMVIYREHINEGNTLYRRFGFPIRLTVAFDKKPFGYQEVDVIDNSGNIQQIKTDKNGSFFYIPRNPGAFQKGQKGFGQNLVVAERILGSIVYKYAYTVLFKHKCHVATQRRDLDMKKGTTIFILSVVLSLTGAIIARKKSKL